MIHAGQILEERWLVVSCLFERDTVEIWLVRDINSDAPLRILKIARTVENHRLENEVVFYRTSLLAKDRPEVYAIGKHQGLLFIVMEQLDELVPATTREDYLRDVMTLIRFAREMDDAKKLYGDYKESNLRRRGKDLKIIDFGTVRRKSDAVRPGHRVGTYGYMAPEVALMRGQSIRSEIFSLGHTARAICHKDLRATFEHVFARATEIDAAKRYRTYRTLALAFALAPYRTALIYTRRIALVSIATTAFAAVARFAIHAFDRTAETGERNYAFVAREIIGEQNAEMLIRKADDLFFGTSGVGKNPTEAYRLYNLALTKPLTTNQLSYVQATLDMMKRKGRGCPKR